MKDRGWRLDGDWSKRGACSRLDLKNCTCRNAPFLRHRSWQIVKCTWTLNTSTYDMHPISELLAVLGRLALPTRRAGGKHWQEEDLT